MPANPVMYLVGNQGLQMTSGKLAAQVAHAAVEAYRLSDPVMVKKWLSGGHYAKVVLGARDSEHLHVIQQYIEDRGFKTVMIIDEGRTEIEPHSRTALGVEVVDKSNLHVQDTFKTFELYKDKIKVTLEINR